MRLQAEAGAIRAGALLAFGFAVLCGTVAAAPISIATYQRGERIIVSASAELDTDPRLVWSVISDYDRLSEFIPGMLSSRVIAREGGHLVVEQQGEFRWWFFRRTMRVRLAVSESPLRRIEARAIGGDFAYMQGRYDIESSGAHVSLRYEGSLVPNFPLPPFVGMLAVRGTLARQFGALVAEIERRAALKR